MKLKKDTLIIEEVTLANKTIIIDWTCNLGFGQLIITTDNKYKFWIDSEYMGSEFVQEVLNKFATYIYKHSRIY